MRSCLAPSLLWRRQAAFSFRRREGFFQDAFDGGLLQRTRKHLQFRGLGFSSQLRFKQHPI